MEPESVPVAAGEVAGATGAAEAVTVAVAVTVALAVGVLVTVGTEGCSVGVSPAVAVAEAALLARLPAASWAALPHPAARHPVARMTAGRNHPCLKDRMSSPSVSFALSQRVAGPWEMVR